MKCRFCEGAGYVRVLSYVDSRKKVKKECYACAGQGTIETEAERTAKAIADERRRILMTDTPYPLTEIVRLLVETAEMYKAERDSDAHGWEIRERAMRRGREWLDKIKREG